jgi:hypothetical protein
MTARELRIGNWVKCKTNDGCKFGKICDILDLGYFATRCNGVEYRCKFDNTGVDIESVEPIEITDELLEKCGYRKVGKHAFLQEDGFISIYKDSITRKYYPYNHWEDIVFGNEINGLHHLQNLCYALKGEELNIEL